MKMTTAIFDLDGTLLNSLGDLCDSVTYAVEKHGFPPVSMEQTRIRIGNGVRKLVERSIPEESRTDEMIDICLADFRAFYGEHMMNRTHPYEGIVSVLETLKENGVTVGVLSNKYDSAAKALIEHYFGDLVSITYGERPNIPRKPDPTSVLQLLDELGGCKIRNSQMAEDIKGKGYDDYEIRCGADEQESIVDFRDAGLPARQANVGPGSVKYTFEWLQCRTIVIDPARTPRAYKEIIEYEHEVDSNGEVIADYPDHNNHWIDALRYATSPLSMRRGNSA